jgi:photosystem II stability/assembly factor-like uncharacterized protein
MIYSNSVKILKYFVSFSLIAILAACSDDDAAVSVFDPTVAPQNVHVVAGDGNTTEVQNTISWTLDDAADDYVVYYSNTPGVTDSSSVVVPAAEGFNYATHSGVDVVQGTTYYYRVQATAGTQSSVLSDEVAGTPQLSVTTNKLNDVAWNGANVLVAVGDSGVILNSSNGVTGAWSAVDPVPVSESLAGVTWGNAQFLVVGAGGTVLSSTDGANWSAETSNVTADLDDVTWSVDRYIAVGKNGTIIISNGDGSWTAQLTPATATTVALQGVASNDSRIVAVGSNGTMLVSDDGGVNWSELPQMVNNDLNDVTWDGSQFVAVGSDDTILLSDDGLTWAAFSPGTSDINFRAVTQEDSLLTTDPVLAAVGSSGDFIQTDTTTVLKVETGTSEQLEGITSVDDGVAPAYFVIVGNDGTVLTSQEQ